MKEFMFIFRGPIPTPEQEQAAVQKMSAWVGQLIAQGRFVGGNPLAPGGKTIQGKTPLITDGPFAEGKEYLGGCLTVKADSLEDASELALTYPLYDHEGLRASVEIREVVKMM
jgi:hypothetical protein